MGVSSLKTSCANRSNTPLRDSPLPLNVQTEKAPGLCAGGFFSHRHFQEVIPAESMCGDILHRPSDQTIYYGLEIVGLVKNL
jgi:hypothetical protein